VAVAALLGACGDGGDSPTSDEPAGTYDLRVTEASFPTEQRLGQTTDLVIAVRNTGDRKVPLLTATISLAAKNGDPSKLPFGIRERQDGLAQPDRPVWVLSPGYPKLDGSTEPGGASTANSRTFALGPLKPGEATTALWKLSAVKAGDYTIRYLIGAGFSSEVKARTEGDVAPGGSFAVEIDAETQDSEVTDSGDVVEITEDNRSNPTAEAQPGGDTARVVPRSESE
jgi:hypothetical protein